MPPLPVIDDVVRVAFEWRLGSTPQVATNVMHFLAPGAGPDLVFAQLEAHVDNNMWDSACNNAAIVNVRIQPLDGSTAAFDFTPSVPTSWTGQGGTQCMPQVATIVKLTTNLSGRSHRGRVFLPFTAEAVVLDGLVDEAVRAEQTAAWVTFANDLVADDTIALAVASYTLGTATQVNNLAVEHETGTQRRRQSRNRA